MTLFIDACARHDSRTRRLAEHVLAGIGGRVTELKLCETEFDPTDEAYLARREELLAEKNYEDPMFGLASTFASADRIVIAAPYWDLSFPAVLKQYFEKINVPGITFFYTPEGIPQGHFHAVELIYVQTAGGYFVPEEFGYGYVKSLAENFYGIGNVRLVQAVGLDIDGADPEAILSNAIEQIT